MVSEYKKLNIKRRRQKVSKKAINATGLYKKTLKSMNATLIEKKDNLDNYVAAIDIEKIEKLDNMRKGTEIFPQSQQEKYSTPKVEMKTVQRKDDQEFSNLFQGFPDTVQDTQVGAKPYFSYTVMFKNSAIYG